MFLGGGCNRRAMTLWAAVPASPGFILLQNGNRGCYFLDKRVSFPQDAYGSQ
jgi:hypothetical protein